MSESIKQIERIKSIITDILTRHGYVSEIMAENLDKIKTKMEQLIKENEELKNFKQMVIEHEKSDELTPEELREILTRNYDD